MGGETIPGCKGAGGGKDWDYCYDPKTEVKKPDPCAKNNGGCYSKRKCTNVNGKAKCGNCPKGYTNLGATKCKKAGPVDKNLSGGNSGGAKNLKACTGECDADSQCAKGLKCFQRSKGEKIPGCKGAGGGKAWDYCYDHKTEVKKPAPSMKCAAGSASSCKVTKINTPKYSAGNYILKVTGGKKVKKSTEKNSCPTGYKIWSPRNKNDWTIVYNAMKKSYNNYPRKPHLIIDVTRAANSCSGCNKYAMKSGVSQQATWKTSDGSKWWLRDSKYNEPNGDYHANCYLHVSNVNPNDVRFNDHNCNIASSDYLCQKAQKKKPTKKPTKPAGKGKKVVAYQVP